MRGGHVALVVLVVLGAVAPIAVGGTARAATATAQAGCDFPVTRTDETGTEVTIDEEPDRVVTLLASAAQTMWEIGAKEKVVGVSEYASYLEGAEDREIVLTGMTANLEKIVALEPDLVLAPNEISDDTVESLRNAGLTVYKFGEATSIDFIYEKTRLTGRLVGACEGAEQTTKDMRAEVSRIQSAIPEGERPRVLYTFFGFTAGTDTFVHEIITTAGGRNIAAEAGIEGFKQISDEVVVDRDPEWIVLNSDQPTVPESPAYNGTTAVREGNVVVLDSNYISQAGPRIVRPMRTLAKALHPVAYEQAGSGSTQDPAFSIDNGSLNTSAIEPGGTVTITFEVTNAGGDGTFGAWLYVNGSAKSLTDFRVDAGATRTLTLQREFRTTGDYEIRINEQTMGVVSVRESVAATETPPGRTASPTPTETDTPTPRSTQSATTDTTRVATDGEQSETVSAEGAETTGESTATDGTGADAAAGTTATASAGQPGFGILTALVGLLAALVLARRRA